MTASVRYYADAKDHNNRQQILDLLNSVPLPNEIVRIEIRHGQIDREYETKDKQTAYRRLLATSGVERTMGVTAEDIVPVAPALGGRVGISLGAESDNIDYITPTTHRLVDSVDSDNWQLPVVPINLLMALRDDPDAILNKLNHRIEISGTEQETLEDWLADDSTPLNEVEREVKIGPHQSMPNAGEGTRTMRADGVHVNDNGSAELIEIKQRWRGVDLQKAFGQLCVGRNMAEQFLADVNVCGSILVIGDSEWSPSWGWPGSTKPVVSAFDEAGIRV